MVWISHWLEYPFKTNNWSHIGETYINIIQFYIIVNDILDFYLTYNNIYLFAY